MTEKIMLGVFLLVGFAGIASAGDADAGKDLFTAKCAICHGADASGNTAMGKKWKIRNLRTPEVQKQSDAELTTIITKGKAGKMPAFEGKLTSDQVSQLVAYIREVGKQPKK